MKIVLNALYMNGTALSPWHGKKKLGTRTRAQPQTTGLSSSGNGGLPKVKTQVRATPVRTFSIHVSRPTEKRVCRSKLQFPDTFKEFPPRFNRQIKLTVIELAALRGFSTGRVCSKRDTVLPNATLGLALASRRTALSRALLPCTRDAGLGACEARGRLSPPPAARPPSFDPPLPPRRASRGCLLCCWRRPNSCCRACSASCSRSSRSSSLPRSRFCSSKRSRQRLLSSSKSRRGTKSCGPAWATSCAPA